MDRRTFLSAATACGVLGGPSACVARAQPVGRFSNAARYSADHGGASFMVVRNGIVLVEDYPGGGSDARWPLGMATRAFAPVLAALLVHDGMMGLDEPVSMTLGEWGADPLKSVIPVRALLNGTSGLAFAHGSTQDAATAITSAPIAQVGARFIDDAAPYLIFAELAHRKLAAAGVDPDPALYVSERVLAPIGCTPIGWSRGADGAAHFDTGAFVSAAGWAAVGELIRRGGVWRAEQMADEISLGEALRGSFVEARAGFGFWLAAPSRQPISCNSDLWRVQSPAPVDLAMAAGDGGQRLYIVPSQALVIVRQTRSDAPDPQWSDAHFLSLLWADL